VLGAVGVVAAGIAVPGGADIAGIIFRVQAGSAKIAPAPVIFYVMAFDAYASSALFAFRAPFIAEVIVAVGAVLRVHAHAFGAYIALFAPIIECFVIGSAGAALGAVPFLKAVGTGLALIAGYLAARVIRPFFYLVVIQVVRIAAELKDLVAAGTDPVIRIGIIPDVRVGMDGEHACRHDEDDQDDQRSYRYLFHLVASFL